MAEGASTVTSQGLQASAHFYDLDDLNHAISGSNLELVQLEPGLLDVTLSQASFGNLSVDFGIANLPIRVRGGLDPLRFTLGAFLPGARATWNGLHVDASQLLIFPPGNELNGHLFAAYGWTSLVIPDEWLSSIGLSARPADLLGQSTSCRAVRPDAKRLADLRQATAQIVSSVAAADPAVAEWLTADVRNAVGAVLSSIDTATIATKSSARQHFDMAHRAEGYMRERIAEPVCIDDLCVAMRASRRYLEYAFADAFGTSPSRYLRLLRLHEVRRKLKAPGGRTSVTNEALAFGFDHLSLFSAQYRKAFGESPSTTLANAGNAPS